jgi:hypothetical protein
MVGYTPFYLAELSQRTNLKIAVIIRQSGMIPLRDPESIP